MKDYYNHIVGYAKNDFKVPKISSIKFLDFIKRNNLIEKNQGCCIDIGSGPGSGTYFLAKNLEKINFIGIDYNKKLVDWANNFFKNDEGKEYYLNNMSIKFGDWNKPSDILDSIKGQNIQTVISVHSLCTQNNFEEAAKNIIKLNPQKIVFNSLFYEGPLDVFIHINDRNSNLSVDNPDANFNIHSLQFAEKFLRDKGYSNFVFEKFDIGKKLERPNNGERGTYTIQSDFSEFTQFSGPVYLPWYFVAATR
jgi:23S rRNA U2552 (ribose-2'-O)-methylase RlmE/FtsJ